MSAAGLAPITTPVACAGQQHELRWADGALSAPNHPSADRERALAALGADPAPCLQILDAWTRHADDLDVLVLASRGPADALAGVDNAAVSHLAHARPGHASGSTAAAHTRISHSVGWTSYAPMSSMRRRYVDYAQSPDDEVNELLGLGPALVHRLTATVITTWADRIADNDVRVIDALPMLDAAVYGRVSSALLSWLGEATTLELALQRPGGDPAISRDGRTVSVAVPFAWLRDVWIPGLSVVLDRFCLRAGQTGGTWTLDTVTRALDDVHTVTITG